MSYLSLKLFIAFRQRQKKPIFFLSEGMIFLTIGIWISFIGLFLSYHAESSAKGTYYAITSYALLYFTLAVSNIYIYAFIEHTFFNANHERLFYIASIEGVALGLMITRIRLLPDVDKLNPFVIVYHVSIAFGIYLLLTIVSWNEQKRTNIRKAKYGLRFIMLFALFQALAYIVLFIGMFNYYKFGFIPAFPIILFAILELLASIFGYFGYILPSWIQNFLNITTQEVK